MSQMRPDAEKHGRDLQDLAGCGLYHGKGSCIIGSDSRGKPAAEKKCPKCGNLISLTNGKIPKFCPQCGERL